MNLIDFSERKLTGKSHNYVSFLSDILPVYRAKRLMKGLQHINIISVARLF